ncbi:MAG: terminase [Rhodospirillales bacterium]|nr:terminase [Rhodospirillales bacterium]
MTAALQQPDPLVAAIAKFYFDPLGFVYFAFPWGQEGTPLAEDVAPDDWQAAILTTLGEALRAADGASEAEAVQVAVSSGHGVGKTALVAWIILWFMSTRPHPQVVATANTAVQLTSKTWRELAKWHRLSRNREWFEWTATRFYLKSAPETWVAHAIPWNKDNAEAFAGTHDAHVLMVFDEASNVADEIWEVASGAMTTAGAVWLALGNPTRTTGRFRECFRAFKHRWITRTVDSRTARKANQRQIEQWIEDYGEDSDFVRVRVRGVFPRAGSSQFIPEDLVYEARRREPVQQDCEPKFIGVDVARYGNAQSVILVRQGRNIVKIQRFRGLDTQQLAAHVGEAIREHSPQTVFVDGVGVGGGVVDRLRALGFRVVDVNAGGQARRQDRFRNKRSEMWSDMRDWIRTGGCLPADDRELAEDLGAPAYGFDAQNRVFLEKKPDLAARGVPSPDTADALALTFAEPVARDYSAIEIPTWDDVLFDAHNF